MAALGNAVPAACVERPGHHIRLTGGAKLKGKPNDPLRPYCACGCRALFVPSTPAAGLRVA